MSIRPMLPMTTIILVLLLLGGCPLTGFNDVPNSVPDFDAAQFTNPTRIDNPYFPLVPGSAKTYELETSEGLERTVVEVLNETRVVAGVTCRVVRDTVTLNGQVIEDTYDWFAQDDDGNVWYMGEEVDNYNYDDSGALLDITHEGSWEAGQDVLGLGVEALPGYQMLASPTAGANYYQEYYAGEAEDQGEVVSLSALVTLSNGTTYTCLQTRDFTELDPDAQEYKYYAPGVGLVAEEPVGGGARGELVSIE